MVDEFIREKIIRINDSSEVTQNEVYEKYINFCLEKGEQPESKIWFGRIMNIFDYPSKQVSKNTRVYQGLMVKD